MDPGILDHIYEREHDKPDVPGYTKQNRRGGCLLVGRRGENPTVNVVAVLAARKDMKRKLTRAYLSRTPVLLLSTLKGSSVRTKESGSG